MRLSELIYRGILGASGTERLGFEETTNRVEFSERDDAETFRTLLLNLFYPVECTDEERSVFEGHRDPRLALRFTKKGREFRIARRAAGESVRLQRRSNGEWESVSRGARSVSEVLRETFDRPDLRTFRALNFWDFETPTLAAGGLGVDLSEYGPEAAEMVEEYRETLELDRVERELARVRDRIEEIREQHEEGFRAERELERAERRLDELDEPDLSEEEFEMLRQRDERLEEYHETLEELREEEEAQRRSIERLDPDVPWRERAVHAGLGIGLAAMAISFFYAGSLRWVALVNPVAFGFVAWAFLVYLTDREKVNLHKVRVDSIKRRRTEVRREMVEFREKIDHLLVHEEADSPEELLRRRREFGELEETLADLEERVEQYAETPAFREAKERLAELEGRRDSLEEAREELPDFGADLFQVENGLHAIGIDPDDIALDDDGSDEPVSEQRRPFALLCDLAREGGMWGGDGLAAEVLGLWQKMAGHVLDPKFEGVVVGPDGEVGIASVASPDEFDGWLRDHRRERQLLAGTLALALHFRARSAERVETVVLLDPERDFSRRASQGVADLFERGPDRSHAVFA